MSHPDLCFKITDKFGVDVDLPHNRAVISCETTDGKPLRLEASYQLLDKIHDEIRKKLDRD